MGYRINPCCDAGLSFLLCIYFSFKSLDDFRQLPAYAPPVKMGADKLYQCFYKKPYADLFFKNSIIVLIGARFLCLFALMAGFALLKSNSKAENLSLIISFLLMLPMQVALIPLFTIFNKMGLINTYPAIILPQIAFFHCLIPFSCFIHSANSS